MALLQPWGSSQLHALGNWLPQWKNISLKSKSDCLFLCQSHWLNNTYFGRSVGYSSSTCCLRYTYSNSSIKALYTTMMVAAVHPILWRVKCSQLARLKAILLNYCCKVDFCRMIVHEDEKQMQSRSMNFVLSFRGSSPQDNKYSTNPSSHGPDTNYGATTLPEWHKQSAASHPITILYVLLFQKLLLNVILDE